MLGPCTKSIYGPYKISIFLSKFQKLQIYYNGPLINRAPELQVQPPPPPNIVEDLVRTINKLTHSVVHFTPLKYVPSSVGSEHLGHLQTKNFVSARWASRCAVPHNTSVYEIDR